MSSDFKQLIADIEQEAQADRGTLAESFSEAQRAIARSDVASLAAITSSASRRRAQAAFSRHARL